MKKKCQGGSTGKIVSFTDVDKKPKLTVYGTCSNSEKIESGDSDRSKKGTFSTFNSISDDRGTKIAQLGPKSASFSAPKSAPNPRDLKIS